MEITDEAIIDYFDTLKERVLKENRGQKRAYIPTEPVFDEHVHVIVAEKITIEIGV